MAEIKSAIELAMERTKTLVMDEKEKKEVERREVETRILGIIRRYMDGGLEKRDVVRELEGLAGSRALKDEIFLDVLLDILDFRDDNGRQLDLFTIGEKTFPETLRSEFELLCARFSDDLERKELIVRERLREGLRDQGISGDAVDVNVQVWDEWKESADETKAAFHGRLTEWKKRVRSAMGHR